MIKELEVVWVAKGILDKYQSIKLRPRQQILFSAHKGIILFVLGGIVGCGLRRNEEGVSLTLRNEVTEIHECTRGCF